MTEGKSIYVIDHCLASADCSKVGAILRYGDKDSSCFTAQVCSGVNWR